MTIPAMGWYLLCIVAILATSGRHDLCDVFSFHEDTGHGNSSDNCDVQGIVYGGSVQTAASHGHFSGYSGLWQ